MELTDKEERDLRSLEVVIQRNLASFVEAGNALSRIRDERLYRASHGTFEDYCLRRWQISQPQAQRLMNSARTVSRLQSHGEHVRGQPPREDGEDSIPIGMKNTSSTYLPKSESVAREVGRVPPERQAEVWERVVATAPRDQDGEPKVTAAHARQVVEESSGHDTNHSAQAHAKPSRDKDADLRSLIEMVKDGGPGPVISMLAVAIRKASKDYEDVAHELDKVVETLLKPAA